MTRGVACPVCAKQTAWSPENRCRPFCSERCRLIDLGAWLEGDYHLPGDQADLPGDRDDDAPPPSH